jgi:hypothetical protein
MSGGDNLNQSKMDSYASEYCMSGGDNAASRKQIKDSIISKATTNEQSYSEALQEGLKEISE